MSAIQDAIASSISKISAAREREEICEFAKLSPTEKFRLLTCALDFLPIHIMVPVTYGDGSPVPNEVLDRLMLDLSARFGGWLMPSPSFAGWIDGESKHRPAEHRLVTVHVPEGKRGDLRDWVRRTGKELNQEVMVVMECGGASRRSGRSAIVPPPAGSR
jgi:hypothetical protein